MKNEKIIHFSFNWLPDIFITTPAKGNKTFRKDFKSNQWNPFRFREDKTAIYKQSLKTGQFEGPNGLNTAKRIRELLQKPITLEMITTGQVYYTGVNRNKTIIKAMLDFNNYVKRMMYNKYLKSGMSLLELAGGRGGDLFKFMIAFP